jgi:hypothetical protein
VGDWAEAASTGSRTTGLVLRRPELLLEWLIEGVLWLLQARHPLVVVGVFVASPGLQRTGRPAACARCFLFV